MAARPLRAPADVSLVELLDLEPVGRDGFRAPTVFDERYPLYGGQVAAQALLAAGRTVPDGRPPHSLHGYFLRSGDTGRPTLLRVERDRDGRSFSTRRVVAEQDDQVVFTLSASFQTSEDGLDQQVDPVPGVPGPEESAPFEPPRLLGFEGRQPPQPHGGPWPTRFWGRCTEPLPDDDLLHAAVLTYLSDIMTGLLPLTADGFAPSASLDHALWFHRPARIDRWMLMDLVGRSTGGGRGWYSGSLSTPDGVLRASIAQESLFRRQRRGPRRAKG